MHNLFWCVILLRRFIDIYITITLSNKNVTGKDILVPWAIRTSGSVWFILLRVHVFGFSFGAPWIRSVIFPCFSSSVCSVFGRQSIDKDSSLKWPIMCSWGRQTHLTRSFTHWRC